MGILLDTHVFLWMITWDEPLQEAVRDVILDSVNTIYLSPVSVWETLVKWRLGELSVMRLLSLPNLHRDPFDRMLICQAICHDLVIATADAQIRQYPVAVLPA